MSEQPDSAGKASVRITLESTADGDKLTRELDGEWYYRNKTVYVKYVEEDEGNRVRTLISWKDGVLKVTRRGDAESEQAFSIGRRLPGYYANGQVRLNLDSETSLLRVVAAASQDVRTEGEDSPQPALPLLLEWHYTLWSDGELAGTFVIRLYAESRTEGDDEPNGKETD